MTNDLRAAPDSTTEAGDQVPRRKLKKLVFSALAIQGAVGMAAMVVSAQAHGNASSHSAVQLDWDFDNFVVRREAITSPASPTASLLRDLNTGVMALTGEVTTRRRELGTSVDSASDRAVKLDTAKRLIESDAALKSQLRQLTNTMALRPSTKSALDLLTQGRRLDAIAAIESTSSDPAAALNEYSLVQLDLMNYSAVDGLSTPAMLPEIIAVSQAGVAYQRARAPGQTAMAASMLHNLASAAAPDTGSPTAEQHSIGRQAAADALTIRTQLGDAAAIGMAEYMVGLYQYKDQRFADAEQTFTSARQKLRSTPANEQYAWVALFLGYTQLASGNPEGQQLVNEARASFAQLGSSFGQRYISAGLGRNQ